MLLLTRGMRLLKAVTPSAVRFNNGRWRSTNGYQGYTCPTPGSDPRFLPYLILGNEQRVQNLVDLAGHGTGYAINSDELSGTAERSSCRPLHEQRAITVVLMDVDALISSLEALIVEEAGDQAGYDAATPDR